MHAKFCAMETLEIVRSLLSSGPPSGSGVEPPPDEAVRALDAYLEASASASRSYHSRIPTLDDLPAGEEILQMEPARQVGVVHAGLERLLTMEVPPRGEGQMWGFRLRRTIGQVLDRLLARKLPVSGDPLFLILERMARITEAYRGRYPSFLFPDELPVARIFTLVERLAGEAGLPPEAAERLQRIHPPAGHRALDEPEMRKLAARLDALLGGGGSALPETGEPWADALREDLCTAPAEERVAWEPATGPSPAASG